MCWPPEEGKGGMGKWGLYLGHSPGNQFLQLPGTFLHNPCHTVPYNDLVRDVVKFSRSPVKEVGTQRSGGNVRFQINEEKRVWKQELNPGRTHGSQAL